MTMAVEAGPLYKHGDVDEAAYERFYQKTLKSYRRVAAKGRGLYAGWTDEQCIEAAGFYCRSYRHQFRVLVPVTR